MGASLKGLAMESYFEHWVGILTQMYPIAWAVVEK